MSLRDGTKKMSKSDESDMTRINLTDDADAIAKKIRKAKTDPEPLPSELKGLEARPEADNLVGIYAGLAETSKEEVLAEFGDASFSKFKEALAELATDRLTPIGEEMRRLMADPVEIDRILADGAAARSRHRRPDPGQDQGHRRLHPQLASGFDAGADLAGDAGAAEPAIAVRVLGEILLVIVLGEIEFRRRQDLGGDGAEPLRGERASIGRLRGLGGFPLRLGIVIDARAILRADIVALAHALGRVVALPEQLQQLPRS